MAFKQAIDKFGKTEYSKDKEYLNAIVTSDTSFKVKAKKQYAFKLTIYIYAAVIFLISALSIGMLGISNKDQQDNKAIFSVVEILVFVILTIDLSLRWYTSEVRLKKGNWSYFRFPFTVVGFMMIASLLPSLYLINVWTGEDYKIFDTLGNMKFLRIFRIILLANLVPALGIFKRVLTKEKSTLYVVFSIVLITILVFALVMYNVEGLDSNSARKEVVDTFNLANGKHYTVEQVFDGVRPTGIILTDETVYQIKSMIKIHTFGDALYFSTVALTTIGFGDISPITSLGRAITMVMSIIGIAVLATPSGVIAGGFIQEVKESRKLRETKKSKK